MLLPLQRLCLLSKKTGNFFFPMHFFLSQEMFWSCFPQTGLVLMNFFFLEEGEKYKSHHLVYSSCLVPQWGTGTGSIFLLPQIPPRRAPKIHGPRGSNSLFTPARMTSSRLLCQCSHPDDELRAGMAGAAPELPLATPCIPACPRLCRSLSLGNSEPGAERCWAGLAGT